jgi:hypothetical protein
MADINRDGSNRYEAHRLFEIRNIWKDFNVKYNFTTACGISVFTLLQAPK